jgi:Flp pilus assembly pilin Flp
LISGGIVSRLWTRLIGGLDEETGASMVEYALLVVLIAIIAILAIRLAGNQVSTAFSEIGSGLN